MKLRSSRRPALQPSRSVEPGSLRWTPGSLVRISLLSLLALACHPAKPAAESATPLPAAHARPLTDVRFERTAERRERGRYLAEAAIGCSLCHSERAWSVPGAPPIAGREFAGAVLYDEPDFRLAAPNLTPDAETGAGTWSDDMLARAIREGVGHDGRGLRGPMWWWAFRALSDEDVASIVVFLRSLPPVQNAVPARRLSPEREKASAEAARPLTQPVATRALADPVARGTYLIEIADCAGCHSAWEAPTSAGLLAGGNRVERGSTSAWSANLTPDALALGGWTAEMFRGRIRSGRGGTLHDIMPWAAYRGMTDADLDAIFAALSTVPAVRHVINNVDPPTPCPVCGQSHPLGELNHAPVYERVAVDAATLPSCAGAYRNEEQDWDVTILFHDGALWKKRREGEIELVPVAGGEFRAPGAGPFSFERDASGAVVALRARDLGTFRLARVR